MLLVFWLKCVQRCRNWFSAPWPQSKESTVFTADLARHAQSLIGCVSVDLDSPLPPGDASSIHLDEQDFLGG
jgi:hypothetical protein